MPWFPRGLILAAAAVTAGGGVVGCSAPMVDDVADASGGTTQGLVVVERSVSREGATQTNVSAKFMRLSTSADNEVAEKLVGSRLDLPPVGECRPVEAAGVDASPKASVPFSSLAPIDLIDVGDLTLHAGDSHLPLATRAFPDVADLVSGVFYTSRDAAAELPSGGTYTLEGTGSTLIDRFSIEADAPPALEDVTFGDTALAEGPALAQGVPTVIRWRAAEAVARGDRVLVDVTSPSGAVMRCSFRDEGRGVLPASVLEVRHLGALPAQATVTMHRVRQRPLAIPGLDGGEIRFDLSVAGRATIEARGARAIASP